MRSQITTTVLVLFSSTGLLQASHFLLETGKSGKLNYFDFGFCFGLGSFSGVGSFQGGESFGGGEGFGRSEDFGGGGGFGSGGGFA